MSIRLMVWNIQAFGLNKMRSNAFDHNGSRANYISASIREADPHILVVIEVRTGQSGGVGTLITDASGGLGVRNLLRRLPGGNVSTQNGPWAVVAPLLLNVNTGRNRDRAYSEGMAVYFRSDLLDFTGPYKWTGVQHGAQPIVANLPPGDYPFPWSNCLPATNPAGGNIPQNRLAGQPIFWDNNGQQIFFGRRTAIGGNGRTRSGNSGGFIESIFTRNPWLTTFREKPPVAFPRTIKIWSVHFPPNAKGSQHATAALADIPEVTAPLNPGEVRVLCGDFNVNSRNPAQANIFDQLTNNVQRVPRNTTDLYALRFSRRTLLRSVTKADVTGFAPYYDYTKDADHHPLGLDNILTAYGPFSGNAAGYEIINRVVGTPPSYTCAMLYQIPSILMSPLPNQVAHEDIFRRLENFGKIGGGIGASDHMALVIDL